MKTTIPLPICTVTFFIYGITLNRYMIYSRAVSGVDGVPETPHDSVSECVESFAHCDQMKLPGWLSILLQKKNRLYRYVPKKPELEYIQIKTLRGSPSVKNTMIITTVPVFH
jgi:hypothetical protein